ncbi:NAD-dependent epimerase/dehydratase family protein [Salibacteraceae bacterium]|nr:NAD-dependent epimerase/dehydratase family protein [Salibacteraceae bacterium]
MKTFVTGADGMLGTNVVLELLSRNHDIVCLVHPSSKSKTLKGLPVQIITGDVLNVSSFESYLSNCEYVVHIAASTSVWPGRNELVNRINIEGTRNVMTASQRAGVKRFIHVGSANSFDPGTLENPGTEANDYTGWKYNNDYLDSKYKTQLMLLGEFRKNKFPVIIISPTFMLGPYDSGPTSGRLLLSMVEGKVPGYSKGVKNFVHTKDVAKAIANALTMGRLGEVYIAGCENMDYATFFNKVKTISGVEKKLFHFPFFLVLIGGFFSSVFARIIGKQPDLSYGMVRLMGIEQYYSSAKAVKELQMPQTPTDKAIEDCLNWFKANNIKL